MNKNLYQSRFSVAPAESSKNRSQQNISYTRLTTANFGKLVPFYLTEVLPGDTFDVSTRMLARMSTPIYPVMDNAFIDYYYFFVPNRLLWDHWAAFLGENKMSAWTQNIEYFVPHASIRSVPGSLSDHMGIPTYSGTSPSLDINFLPFRAYDLIWNEWFRDQNTTDPILINTGDSVTAAELERVATLRNVTKYFDYFTSCLPSPQKGDAVDIPLGDYAPLITLDYDVGFKGLNALRWYTNNGNTEDAIYNQLWFARDRFNPDTDEGLYGGEVRLVNESDAIDVEDYGKGYLVNPANLVADLSGVTSVTVNLLRQAFQMQRLLELQARSGTRYVEIIKASFGVMSPDARMMRPEYLGGTRVPVQMQQVTQMSSSDSVSPLGNTGAYSKTISGHRDFVQSFTEHGYVIGVMCARTAHTYQQGLHKMWSRRGRFDFYWPTFAHIGEQPVLVKEIYAQGTAADDEVFGYQEAWAEYRYKPNEVTGGFRSTVDGNLDEWHYADFYANRPYLSSGWIAETDANVDRTLAVTSELADQLIFDIAVDNKASRVMPLYSVPGLIDHF